MRDVGRVILAVGLSVGAGLAALTGQEARTALEVQGMTCGGCVAAVKLQLKRTEGVTGFEVSLEKSEALVSFDAAKTTPEKIAESVSRTGFKASVKSPGGETKTAAAALPEGTGGAAASSEDLEASGMVSLADDVSRLASDFNAVRAKRRFLAILSPTCSACVHGAEAIKAAILPASPAVEVFVVWSPMLAGDGASAAASISAIVAGPNVRQYWDPSRRAGTSFRKDVFPDAEDQMKRAMPKDHFFSEYLGVRDGARPEWDIYLFFEPGAEWTARAPIPSRWIRQVARFAKREGGDLISLMWKDDYESAPVEGSLPEELRRLVTVPGTQRVER